MTIFNNIKSAVEFVEIMMEENADIDCLLIMKRENEFLVTEDFKSGKNEGFKSYESIYR